MMLRRVNSQLPTVNSISCRLSRSYSAAAFGGPPDVADDEVYAELPRPPKSKSERKPYPTPMKLLIRRAKEEKEARKLQPCRILETAPENGLLVPELVGVAHHVYRARGSLLKGLAELVRAIPVQRCRFCSEVHVGQTGHEIRTCTGPKSGFRSATHEWRKGGAQDVVSFPKSYHLYDRVGKPRVGHDEKHKVPRIPAVVELCIQAGVDLEKYPSKRRTKPVYSIEGRIVDFESVSEMGNNITNPEKLITEVSPLKTENQEVKKYQNETGVEKDLKQLSIETMGSWFEMVEGVKKMMESYAVWTCGYCPEVQVGPKGHKVRICKASKHQSRNGLHAWQEATIEDVIGHNYVWHSKSSALYNDLKRFYGKAPAVVELCVWGGAPIPNEFKSMMRLDVVSPDRDEVDLVA